MSDTSAESYAAWYSTPRGRWIGDIESACLLHALRPRPNESLLDVGCGTGYFTRRLSEEAHVTTVGLDPNVAWLSFARHHSPRATYVAGLAERLPFPDASFDCTMAITSLCFVGDLRQALAEIVRVTRRRFVLGLLNRRSLLYLQKGRHGGSGAYRGARWDTASEIRHHLAELPVWEVTIRSVILLAGGGTFARKLEAIAAGRSLLGAFLVAAGSVSDSPASAPVP
jgi:SAM-dependent methyltransferase